MRIVAWVVFLAWAAFWLFFNIASGVSEIDELGPMALISHLWMPALILLALGVAWRWPLAGGILLIGLVVLFVARFGWQGWQLAALLEAPPLVAGLLLVAASWWGHRQPPGQQPAA